VNLNNSQKTTELLPLKHKKIMAFPPKATFGQLFPFQTSFEAKRFSSLGTVVVWLTRQQKARTEMRTKATVCSNLEEPLCRNCVHDRNQNASKRPQTETNGNCPC